MAYLDKLGWRTSSSKPQVVELMVEDAQVTGCEIHVTEQSWRQSLVSNIGRVVENRMRSDLLGGEKVWKPSKDTSTSERLG